MTDVELAKQQLDACLSALNSAVYNYLQGNDTPVWFSAEDGICDNMVNWGVSTPSCTADFRLMKRCLVEMFRRDGLHPMYPFNTSASQYGDECGDETIWQNEHRLQWLADHS